MARKTKVDSGPSLAKEFRTLHDDYLPVCKKSRELQRIRDDNVVLLTPKDREAFSELQDQCVAGLVVVTKTGQLLKRRTRRFLETHDHTQTLDWFERTEFARDVRNAFSSRKHDHKTLEDLEDLAYRLDYLPDKAAVASKAPTGVKTPASRSATRKEIQMLNDAVGTERRPGYISKSRLAKNANVSRKSLDRILKGTPVLPTTIEAFIQIVNPVIADEETHP